MNKLVVCIMGQNCQKFLGMCFDSIKTADAIVYCDGGSDEDFCSYFTNLTNDYGVKLIYQEYNQEDKTMNGKQRNFYLNYLKQNYPNDWALCLDADEIVEDLESIKQYIQNNNEGIVSVKMRHLVGDLGHEDAVTPTHYVLNRLFKIDSVESYPEVEHPVLQPKQGVIPTDTDCTTIWHLAYVPNMWDIKKRYFSHLKKSNMHTPEYLKQWYHAHLFGKYPVSELEPVELPKQLLDEFGLNRDELYFKDRNKLEVKHFLDAYNWKNFFKPEKVLEIGAGLGVRTFAMNSVGLNVLGTEISEYATYNNISNSTIVNDDIVNTKLPLIKNFDLVVAYDVLEHIEYKDIDKAIDNIINLCKKHILVSVPTIGDYNLERDKTHKIKEKMEWWKNKFISKGCKEVAIPNYFLFKEQQFIMEVSNGNA